MRTPELTEYEIELAYQLAKYGARPTFIRDLIGEKNLSKVAATNIYTEVNKQGSPRGRHACSEVTIFECFDTWVDCSVVVMYYEKRQKENAHAAHIYCNVYEQHCRDHLSLEPLPFDLLFSIIRAYVSGRLKLGSCEECGYHHLTSLRVKACPWCLQAESQKRTVQRDLFGMPKRIKRMRAATQRKAVA